MWDIYIKLNVSLVCRYVKCEHTWLNCEEIRFTKDFVHGKNTANDEQANQINLSWIWRVFVQSLFCCAVQKLTHFVNLDTDMGFLVGGDKWHFYFWHCAKNYLTSLSRTGSESKYKLFIQLWTVCLVLLVFLADFLSKRTRWWRKWTMMH